MKRTLTIKNLYDKTYKTFEFNGIWADVMGEPERHGAWIIWGKEKNGKTSFALMLANYLTQFGKVLYISAEEGSDKAFRDACKRANIVPSKRGFNISEYEEMEEVSKYLKLRKSAKIVFIDNITIYADELKNGAFRKLLQTHPNVLFVFIAHEERGEPYTATAKLCRKLAKIIMHVQGLACNVSGRCPGGQLIIDEEKAALYHGQ